MDFKLNFNKLHSELTNKYGNVKVSEKWSPKLGNYIEVIIESNSIEMVTFLSKEGLCVSEFNWLYLSDPIDNNSVVERVSSLNSFLSDVSDVIDNKKFSRDYLNR